MSYNLVSRNEYMDSSVRGAEDLDEAYIISNVQFYDVQKCNSVQIVYSTSVVQKAKSLNYFTTAFKYQLY